MLLKIAALVKALVVSVVAGTLVVPLVSVCAKAGTTAIAMAKAKTARPMDNFFNDFI
jgi:hypothetical protein